MASAKHLIEDIIAKARMAEALVTDPETKQTLVEIRLAARCAVKGVSAKPAKAGTPNNVVRLHD